MQKVHEYQQPGPQVQEQKQHKHATSDTAQLGQGEMMCESWKKYGAATQLV
jgi:hypothetical protein